MNTFSREALRPAGLREFDSQFTTAVKFRSSPGQKYAA
jgi:hypothetical protein